MHSPSAKEASLREVFPFCLPALLLGLILRIALMAWMPLAFFSPDTSEFLGTRLFGGSRTFLPKLLYGLPVRLGLPFLPSIAVVQHLLGLAAIVVMGCLCVQWLRYWRWWIIPLTCVLAIHPTLLWYEHFALPDSMFVLLTMLVCVTGTYFYRNKSWLWFWIFYAILFLTAGMRQEGFIFLLFGLALVIRVFWGQWRRFRIFVPLAMVVSVLVAKICKTNQGGYMLLTSLIQWAPTQLWCEPALSPRIVKLRDHFQPLWPAYPDDHNMSRKLIVADVQDYLLREKGVNEKALKESVDPLSKRIAMEIAARNVWRLPGLAFNKFRAMHEEPPAPDFGPDRAHHKQLQILFGKPDEKLPKEHALIPLYLGREYSSREELEQDLPRIYRVFSGDSLSRFQDAFYKLEYGAHALPEQPVGSQTLPALPLLYFLAALGFIALASREKSALSAKQLWIAMLLFQAFVICLSGSNHGRYRLGFEPWFLLGFFGLLDSLLSLFRRDPPLLPQAPTPAADRPNSDRGQT